jgi:hypothetical protein
MTPPRIAALSRRRSTWLAVAFAIVSSVARAGAIEPPGLEGTLAAHNEIRSALGIAPLVWDAELAASAQAWADQCVDLAAPIGIVDENADRSDGFPWYVGENVYGSAGAATGMAAVALWAAEAQSYDYESNTCSAVCGHYTQTVWAATERVGCGLSSCPELAFGNTVICDYGPGGNTGGRPYEMPEPASAAGAAGAIAVLAALRRRRVRAARDARGQIRMSLDTPCTSRRIGAASTSRHHSRRM